MEEIKYKARTTAAIAGNSYNLRMSDPMQEKPSSSQGEKRNNFLAGGGEMGALIREYDWSNTVLGPPEGWPQGLKTAVRLLLSTGHPMFIWWGTDLIQFYNDAYRRSIGPERHPSALGQGGRQCWAEIWDIIGSQIEYVMAGAGHTWHENHLVPITRHGRREDVYWTYSYGPIHDDDAPKGVGGVLVVCTETTDQVLAEQRMKVAEARWRALFDQAPGFMCILQGPEHTFEYANPRYFEVVGGRELIGKTVLEAMPEVESQGLIALLDNVYRTGRPYRGTATPVTLAQTADRVEQQLYFDFVYQPILNEHGDVTGIFVEGSDVTERVLSSNKIHEADRKKDEFLAMLSHELRNPMAPIFSALQLMSQEGESEIQREAREVMERQMRHLSRLVNDLLEVTRITTGMIKLRVEEVDMNTVVKRAVERQRPQIHRQKQELFLSLADGPVRLEADATRLEQVIDNLLNNASKYGNARGKIWLSVEQAHDQVIVRMRDNGLGISPELLPEIFNLFTQADKSLDRTESGLGIGLALVKSLVELHGGTVEARSEGIGCGSEFILCLPAASELPRKQKALPPSITATGSLRVLVVDDHVDTARMSTMILESWGHEVRMSHNGPDALHILNSFNPHVILLDIGMPNMDGYEAARQVRRMPHLESSLLVAITGYGQEIDRKRSKEAGMDIHLTKPVDPEDLKTILARYASKVLPVSSA